MTTKHKNDTNPKNRPTGLMLALADYSKIYDVSVKTIKQWRRRGYDLDDPPTVWKFIFSHQTWPAKFPSDNGNSWNLRWLNAATERGVIEE